MRIRPLLLCALLTAPLARAVGAPDDADADVAACLASAAKHPRTVFDVVVGTYPTVVERRLDIEGINRLRLSRPPQAFLAHGLCVADYRLTYATKNEATCWKTGGHTCAWLGSVTVNLTPDDIRVYIPKEYAAGSCEANQLLLHEFEHERQHRRGLLQLAARMRDALARAQTLPGPQAPLEAADPAQAYARLKKDVDAVVRPIYEQYLKESEAQQNELDDAQTYRRLGAACSGWKRG